ncbi:MAG TPA: ATP-binding protein [Fimbriimonadaceae bacterium]|nr:ATP-binding protein [Fimbriimonadaceae bacterium]
MQQETSQAESLSGARGLVFLNEASKVLAASLDYEETLKTVANLVVPELADWCGIDLLRDDGTLQRVTVAHIDPEKVSWAMDLHDKYPTDMSSTQGLPQVLRSGHSELYPDISDDLLEASATSEEHLQILREVNIRSAMIVPLTTREKTIGAITFVSARPGHYDESFLALAEDLASRSAFAVENARLYRALAESEQLFRTTADSAPVLIWMSDSQGNIHFFNKSWLDFRGRSLDQEIGDGWIEGMHPDDREPCLKLYTQHFDERSRFELEYRLLREDGVYRWVLDTGVPRYNADGTFAGFTGSCVDITDQRVAREQFEELNAQLERRVQKRTEELEELNRDLEAFSYSVSHDLRAPLRSIRSFAWMLKEDAGDRLDPDSRDSLDRIIASSARMSQLIDDLLAYARVGRTQMRIQKVSLSELAGKVANDLKSENRCSENTVFDIEPNMIVKADQTLLRVALENLLGNACKFSSKVEAPVIEVKRHQQDGQDAYCVRDNGVGFDPRYQHKLFQPFERLHSTAEFAGSGIGLTNVQRIVNRHGGKIWAESAPGEGAAFYFTLEEQSPRGSTEETKNGASMH